MFKDPCDESCKYMALIRCRIIKSRLSGKLNIVGLCGSNNLCHVIYALHVLTETTFLHVFFVYFVRILFIFAARCYA